jgi:hypothetical protein
LIGLDRDNRLRAAAEAPASSLRCAALCATRLHSQSGYASRDAIKLGAICEPKRFG